MHQPMTGTEGEGAGRSGLANFLASADRSYILKSVLKVLKLVLGLALLILSVRGIQWSSLVASLRAANHSWLLLAVLSVLLSLTLKLWRWAIFLRNYHLVTGLPRLFRSYFVGQAANIVLPFRSGELVRVAYFAGAPQVLPQIVATIALEKYLDFLALTVSAVLVSVKFSLDNLLNLRGVFLPLAMALTLILLLVLLFAPQIWRQIRVRWYPKRFGGWMDRWLELNQWLSRPRQFLPGIFLTILVWIVMWLTNLLLFQSLHMPLNATAAGLVLISVYIGLLPALMPGNIGPFYFFASLALLPFGIIHSEAIAFAVILHAIVTLPPLVGGVIGLSLHQPTGLAQ